MLNNFKQKPTAPLFLCQKPIISHFTLKKQLLLAFKIKNKRTNSQSKNKQPIPILLNTVKKMKEKPFKNTKSKSL